MSAEKIIGVHWQAKSYLTDTELMDRLVEHTYFRLLNYIYLTQNRLPDDDGKLWRLCKCKSVQEYRKHKAELMQSPGMDPETGEELPPRIFVKDGNITNKKCTEKLAVASKSRAQKSRAGKSSAIKRKYRKGNKTGATADATDVTTADGTDVQTAEHTAVPTAEGTKSNTYSLSRVSTPLPPESSERTSGSAGGLDGPASRPVDVIAVFEDGLRLAIDRNGGCDLDWAPLEYELPQLTAAQAIAIRERIIASEGPLTFRVDGTVAEPEAKPAGAVIVPLARVQPENDFPPLPPQSLATARENVVGYQGSGHPPSCEPAVKKTALASMPLATAGATT